MDATGGVDIFADVVGGSAFAPLLDHSHIGEPGAGNQLHILLGSTRCGKTGQLRGSSFHQGLRHYCGDERVRDGESATRLQHSERFSVDLAAIRHQAYHAVGYDKVERSPSLWKE